MLSSQSNFLLERVNFGKHAADSLSATSYATKNHFPSPNICPRKWGENKDHGVRWSTMSYFQPQQECPGDTNTSQSPWWAPKGQVLNICCVFCCVSLVILNFRALIQFQAITSCQETSLQAGFSRACCSLWLSCVTFRLCYAMFQASGNLAQEEAACLQLPSLTATHWPWWNRQLPGRVPSELARVS